MAVTRRDYPAETVAAARSVLIELARLLGEYHEHLALVGGWVPELLVAREGVTHIGSTDIDLAVNHLTLPESGYRLIEELLLARGYQRGNQPFIFHRVVAVGGREIQVQVDFLAGEYAGTGPGHRTQPVQGIRARKARGCDLAFDEPAEVMLAGTLPGGALETISVRVASIVPFLVMKGMALHDRLKEKDVWDIDFCIRHYPGGIGLLVEKFRPHVGQGLVQEGLEKIAAKFASPEHSGPAFVADFDELIDPESRAIRQRDAYERVHYLLHQLRVV